MRELALVVALLRLPAFAADTSPWRSQRLACALTQATLPNALFMSAHVFVERVAGASRPRLNFMFAMLIALVGFFSSDLAFGQTNQAYSFLTEYVRELGEIEDVRVIAMKEESENTNKMMACVGNSERFQLLLGEHMRAIQGYTFAQPLGPLGQNIATFYAQKKEIWQLLSETCSALIGNPKPGIDYAELVSQTPKLRARLDYIDKALFEATPVVFATLIDMRPDSKNHVSHLTITTAQRDELVRKLQSRFGSKLAEQGNQNYTVASAFVLKAYLAEKGFKCADETWE
jgi:hypothetical protein